MSCGEIIPWGQMLEEFGGDPAIKLTGWIPPHQRTAEQQRFHEQVMMARVPRFSAVNPMTAAEPDECICLDMLVKTIGGIGIWPWQLTGSCVGVGGAFADMIAMAGDVMAGEMEEIILPFPFATWGFGRQIGGLRGPGDGSFGGAQIEAESQVGYIAHNNSVVPQGKMVDGHWMQWSSGVERSWSWPPQFPVDADKIREIAKPQRLEGYSHIKTLDELSQAYVQGFGVTQASNWGCENPRLVDGLLVGRRDTTWPHQTWQGGYRKVNGTRYWLWGNQWGPKAHGVCPYLAERYGKFGFKGGVMWIPDGEMQAILREEEVFARSATGGFPLRDRIDWSKVQW